MDALDNLLAADCPTRTRHFDVVNITRQLLGNYFSDLYADYVKAYRDGDYEKLHQLEQTMTSILDDTDKILATESAFLVGCWIRDARAIGTSEEDKDYFESNARNIITTWGEEDACLRRCEAIYHKWGLNVCDRFALDLFPYTIASLMQSTIYFTSSSLT